MKWTKLRAALAERTAPSLGSRLAIHQARYRRALEEVGRVWRLAADAAARDHLRRAGEYDDYSALEDLEAYLSLSIEEALESPSPLLRALAVVDRRVGKRRLRQLLVQPDEHPLVRVLLVARGAAEGIRVDERLV